MHSAFYDSMQSNIVLLYLFYLLNCKANELTLYMNCARNKHPLPC